MRRIASALVIIVMALAIGTPAASAEAVVARVGTGTFDGTSVFELFVEECPFIHQVFTGTYDPDRRGVRGGTYEVDACVAQPNADFNYPFSGTFEIVTGHGHSLDGTVTGIFNPNMPIATVDATLTVTGSSGSRHPIRGTITITGTSDQFDPEAPESGSVDHGTFAADLRRAAPA
jgi:hypothetical protein